MKKIITCGLKVDYNFGSPSILHGMFELLQVVYGNDFEMINLQIGSVLPESVADMSFLTYEVKDYSAKRMLMSLCGFISKYDKYLRHALRLIKKADSVIELFGICFCDDLAPPQWRLLRSHLLIALRFPFSYYAKRKGVRSVKNAASYGPISSKYNQKLARFASKHVFDCMVAREEKSRQVMLSCGVRKSILSAPDIANLMRYKKMKLADRPVVGISTSHQIVRQWRSAEDYVVCIAALCLHINNSFDAEVILIPNETDPTDLYNDIDVSEDIIEKLVSLGGHASILNTSNMTSSDIKNHIASCEVVVASRYHSCVAALSAGVPLMVVGWHYKYEELLHWYGQDDWLLSESDCNTSILIDMFDKLWQTREERRAEIVAHYPEVRDAVIAAGKSMLGVYKDRKNE
ncbi:MAG: polysaccharide pyruvyl transferase family protein [Clostridiales bacterium]|jgi:polysaccharide pyruvyl transferase WcaK-like protein|nr:polysaccharide pyruvyl transferase family protein [Clostridiales bacterium]